MISQWQWTLRIDIFFFWGGGNQYVNIALDRAKLLADPSTINIRVIAVKMLTLLCVYTAERRAQLVRSRSRQNLLTTDDSELVHTIEFNSETQSPADSSEPSSKQRVRRSPQDKDRSAGKISAAALDSIMAST